MAETDTLNGTKATNKDTNNHSKQPKNKRYLPSLPTVSSASDMTEVTYKAMTDKTPVEFSSLDNYEIFSMSPDGSFPMVKASKSKAVRLGDRKVFQTGGGRVYRVSISYFSNE